MGKANIVITMDEEFISELDKLIDEHCFQNRIHAIQETVSEKLSRLKHGRLSAECSKLDTVFEKQWRNNDWLRI
jgi:metal-responsive CopG/Arc/MetJ family transcriptional regulator